MPHTTAYAPIILTAGLCDPIILTPCPCARIILTPCTHAPIILTPCPYAPFILTPCLCAPIVLTPCPLRSYHTNTMPLCPDHRPPTTDQIFTCFWRVASDSHLDLSRAPYVLYGVNYIVSLAPYVLYGVKYIDLVSLAPVVWC